jgi:uncharacterized protein affecting Mg2+/Co2+ transport
LSIAGHQMSSTFKFAISVFLAGILSLSPFSVAAQNVEAPAQLIDVDQHTNSETNTNLGHMAQAGRRRRRSTGKVGGKPGAKQPARRRRLDTGSMPSFALKLLARVKRLETQVQQLKSRNYTCPDGYKQKDDMHCKQSVGAGPPGSWLTEKAGAECAKTKTCKAFMVQTDNLESAQGCMKGSYTLKPKSGRVVCIAPPKPVVPLYTCPDGYEQKDDMHCKQSVEAGPPGSWLTDKAGAECAKTKSCEAFQVQTDFLQHAQGCMKGSYTLKPKSRSVVCIAPSKPVVPLYTCPDGYEQKDDMHCEPWGEAGPPGSWLTDKAGAECAKTWPAGNPYSWPAGTCEAFEVQTDNLERAQGCMKGSYLLKPKSGRVVCMKSLKPVVPIVPICSEGFKQLDNQWCKTSSPPGSIPNGEIAMRCLMSNDCEAFAHKMKDTGPDSTSGDGFFCIKDQYEVEAKKGFVVCQKTA